MIYTPYIILEIYFRFSNFLSGEDLLFLRLTFYRRTASSVGSERCFDRAEVTGSNPVQSTSPELGSPGFDQLASPLFISSKEIILSQKDKLCLLCVTSIIILPVRDSFFK